MSPELFALLCGGFFGSEERAVSCTRGNSDPPVPFLALLLSLPIQGDASLRPSISIVPPYMPGVPKTDRHHARFKPTFSENIWSARTV